MIRKEYTPQNLLDVELNSVESYLPGYPGYPTSEDINSKYLEEKNIKPEFALKTKGSNGKSVDD